MLKKTLVLGLALATVATTALSTAGAASADPSIAGTYNAVGPLRILDTRAGIGAPDTPVAPHATLTLDTSDGLDGAAASAVALTVTAVAPTAGGYLAVYPGGTTRPGVSALNFATGRNVPNGVVVPLGADGTISIYNNSNATLDILADLSGYWSAGTVDAATAGALNTLTPARIKDTRTGTGKPAAAHSDTIVPVEGVGGVPATGVAAVAVNLTVTRPIADGYLTATDEAEVPARTSTLNYSKNQTRANFVMVPVNPDGTITIHNESAGTAHFLIDVFAYYTGGSPSVDGSFVPSSAYRAGDTRFDGGGPLPAYTTASLQVLPEDAPPIFKAVVVTVTAVLPQAAGFLTVWDGSTTLPATSNANFIPGENMAGSAIVPVNADGTISVYNGSLGNLNVIIDVHGFMLNDLTTIPANTAKQRIAAAITSAHTFAAKHVRR